MKARIFILTIITFYGICSFSQTTVLQLKVLEGQEAQVLSMENEGGISVNNKLYTLTPSYPNAQNPELQLLYDVVVEDEDVSLLMSEIQQSGDFESILPYEMAYTTSDCLSPLPINDSEVTSGGTINNYAIEIINARCAWNITQGDPNIVIGIVDTEFEETHEDLENQIVHLSGPVSDMNYHGTSVAGAACAETNNSKGICGVGYDSKIAGYRVSHVTTILGGANASSVDIKNAIWEAYLDGRPVVNVSWTTTGLDPLAAQEITENGTTLVLGAGNNATSIFHSAIANIPGVILVSASDQYDCYYTSLTRNQYVDLCAPGVNVAVTYTNNEYQNRTGTSYAAPLVTGAVALMLSVNPNLTPANIETILKKTAAPLLNAHFYPGLVGAGRLDVYAAVSAAQTLLPHNVVGTVFPFVHTSDDTFDALFPVTATLHNVPGSTSRDPLGNVVNSTPLYTTTAEYYDGSIYVPCTPANSGIQGLFNNPGYPIDWAAIGQTPGDTVDNTPVVPDNTPTAPVGFFSFQNVTSGNYILKLSRPGFIPRFAKITVPPNGILLLGHREIIGGDVNGDLSIDGGDISAINPKLYSGNGTSNYEAKYDLNGDGWIDLDDRSFIVNKYQGFYPEVYNDTMDWILEY